jgi:hypothetical protein
MKKFNTRATAHAITRAFNTCAAYGLTPFKMARMKPEHAQAYYGVGPKTHKALRITYGIEKANLTKTEERALRKLFGQAS